MVQPPTVFLFIYIRTIKKKKLDVGRIRNQIFGVDGAYSDHFNSPLLLLETFLGSTFQVRKNYIWVGAIKLALHRAPYRDSWGNVPD